VISSNRLATLYSQAALHLWGWFSEQSPPCRANAPDNSAGAKAINTTVRAHWGIENSHHHVRNVTFDEDRARNRQGRSDLNLALTRGIALTLLKLETSKKASINIKRHTAAMDDAYRVQIIDRQSSCDCPEKKAVRR
jgi:hypothetical protein